jgi:hypothetical protein
MLTAIAEKVVGESAQPESGLPDFSWKNKPKRGKIYQMINKYPLKLTKWPQNILTSSVARPSKIHPHWDFLV